MDVVLEALDAVNQQFELVSRHETLPPVDASLISALERLVSCEDVVPSATATPEADPVATFVPAVNVAEGDITDAEFEQLLDALSPETSAGAAPAVAAGSSSNDISEDEFEALLDQLHGSGKAPGKACLLYTSDAADE